MARGTPQISSSAISKTGYNGSHSPGIKIKQRENNAATQTAVARPVENPFARRTET